MTFLFAALGAVLGGILAEEWTGALFGAVLGVMFARSLLLRSRLRALKLKVEALESKSETARIYRDAPVADEAAVTSPPKPFTPAQEAELTPALVDGARSLGGKEPLLARGALAAQAGAGGPRVPAPAEGSPAREREPLVHGYSEPNPIFALVITYFTGGNPAVRIGIVVLFFGVAFLLKYAAERIFFAVQQRTNGRDYVDAALLFGTPIIVFALQSQLVSHFEYGLAFSALGFSVFYLLAARFVWGKLKRDARMLVEACVALGIVFATLTIPLAFDAKWTAAAWAIEGTGIIWVGVRQNKGLGRLFGAVLQAAAGLAFVVGNTSNPGQPAVFNSFFLGGITLSLAAFVSSYHARRVSEPKAYDRMLSALLLIWAVGWWFAAGLLEVEAHVAAPLRIAAAVGFASVSAALFMRVGLSFDWREIKFPAWGLLVVMLLAAGMAREVLPHPLANGGYLAWPLAFGVYYWILRRSESHYVLLKLPHMATLWLLITLAAWELGWLITRAVEGNTTWMVAAWGLVPALALFALYGLSKNDSWPVGVHRDDYTTLGLWPILVYVFAWSLISNLTSTGNPSALPYLPLLNPLDLAQLAVLVALTRWLTRLSHAEKPIMPRDTALSALGLAGFIWLSAVVVRTLHYWAGMEFSFEAMMASRLVQASLAIFWSLLAFALMYLATRKTSRPLWIAGATCWRWLS